MPNGVNKVILIGNLGKDPEVRFTKSGNAVCNMRLAVNERRQKGDTWEDHTEWVSVCCFGKTAENAGKFLAKGRAVYIEGRMQTSSYEKDGQTRYSTEVVAKVVTFLGGKGDAAPSNGHSRSQQRPPSNSPAAFGGGDDLPF